MRIASCVLLLAIFACDRNAGTTPPPVASTATPVPSAPAVPTPSASAPPIAPPPNRAPDGNPCRPVAASAPPLPARAETISGVRTFDVEVVEVHPCQPCPPGAMCKPCLASITVSDRPRTGGKPERDREVEIEMRHLADDAPPALGRRRVVVEAGPGHFTPWHLVFYCASE